MKLIPLSKNGWKHKGKYFAQVDDEDFEWLNQWDWQVTLCVKRNTAYAERTEYNSEGSKKHSMHRQILGLIDPKIEGDHKDNNGLNNQRNNLRKSTHAENLQNKSKGRNGISSIYKGVSCDKSVYRAKRWKVRIMANHKAIHIGRYLTEIEAALAYDKAAKKYHGEFANLNFK